MAQSAGIQIGELSRRTGCNIETIRYYERIGLLREPARSAGRYRVYDTGDVRRLAFIRRARELSFKLDEVSPFGEVRPPRLRAWTWSRASGSQCRGAPALSTPPNRVPVETHDRRELCLAFGVGLVE